MLRYIELRKPFQHILGKTLIMNDVSFIKSTLMDERMIYHTLI